LNSEYGVIRFNERKSVYMRNWSSFLYNITTSFNRKKGKNDNASFGIKKMLYDKHSKTANQSRAINKGIYICVSTNSKSDYLDDSILVAKTFSEKEFMKLLIEDSENIFYDIPAYHSLIDEGIYKNI